MQRDNQLKKHHTPEIDCAFSSLQRYCSSWPVHWVCWRFLFSAYCLQHTTSNTIALWQPETKHSSLVRSLSEDRSLPRKQRLWPLMYRNWVFWIQSSRLLLQLSGICSTPQSLHLHALLPSFTTNEQPLNYF